MQAGVAKLNEAKQLVDELKQKAGEQSILLAEKQSEADQALSHITESMQVGGGWGNLGSDTVKHLSNLYISLSNI